MAKDEASPTPGRMICIRVIIDLDNHSPHLGERLHNVGKTRRWIEEDVVLVGIIVGDAEGRKRRIWVENAQA